MRASGAASVSAVQNQAGDFGLDVGGKAAEMENVSGLLWAQLSIGLSLLTWRALSGVGPGA